MTEGVDKETSRRMRFVRKAGTAPELIVRRIAFVNGYRFRLHYKSLPGTPDIVFPSRRKVIFVNGCFWHRHLGCNRASLPGIRKEYWQSKFDRNVQRDIRNIDLLHEKGWQTLTIWECETRKPEIIAARLKAFLYTE